MPLLRVSPRPSSLAVVVHLSVSLPIPKETVVCQ